MRKQCEEDRVRVPRVYAPMRLTLPKFDPSTMKPHRVILLIGKRGTGKSTLMEDLLQYMTHIDYALCFSPTQDSLDMYARHMPASWTHTEFDPARIENLVTLQRATPKERKRHVLLVLDDCAADKRVTKSAAIRDLFYNGRHQYCTFVMSMQYCLDLGPDLRSNIDYVICLRDPILANRMRLHKYFYGMFERFSDFSTVFDAVTNNFGALVLDNTTSSNDVCDQLSWYRAKTDLPSFRLGKAVFWEMEKRLAKSNAARANEAMEAKERRRAEERARAARQDRIVSVHKQDEAGNIVDGPVQLLE